MKQRNVNRPCCNSLVYELSDLNILSTNSPLRGDEEEFSIDRNLLTERRQIAERLSK